VPLPKTSRQNLAKANAKGRKPRPWRSPAESLIIRSLAWEWYIDQGPRCSRRGLARLLGVSHTWVQKLLRKFVADLPEIVELIVEGRPLFPEQWYPRATFVQLRAAQEETRRMREQRLVRGSRCWKIVGFQIGDNFVRAVVPTKSYAAALEARQYMQGTVVTINTRRYTRRRHSRGGPRGCCNPFAHPVIPKSDFHPQQTRARS
jgi:hypothetical protein